MYPAPPVTRTVILRDLLRCCSHGTEQLSTLAPMSTLVIVRHGESTWNQENLFTGWHDVPLSAKGIAEARGAGQLMRDDGLWFDVAHTSVLERAVVTGHLALAE